MQREEFQFLGSLSIVVFINIDCETKTRV